MKESTARVIEEHKLTVVQSDDDLGIIVGQIAIVGDISGGDRVQINLLGGPAGARKLSVGQSIDEAVADWCRLRRIPHPQ